MINDILAGTVEKDSSIDNTILPQLLDTITSITSQDEFNAAVNNYLKFLMNNFDTDDAVKYGKLLFQSIKSPPNPTFNFKEIPVFHEYYEKYKEVVLNPDAKV